MVRAYVGLLGSGKTSGMITEAVTQFRHTCRQVYSDMSSLRFPGAVFLHPTDTEAIAAIDNGLVLMDEAGLVMSSAFWKDMSREVLEGLTMLRHNGLDLYYSTPSIDRVYKVLREITSEVIYCQRLGPFSLQTTYDPADLKKPKGLPAIRLFNPRAWALFDTHEDYRTGNRRIGRSVWLERVRTARHGPVALSTAGACFDESPYRWEDGRSCGMTPKARAAGRFLQACGYAAGEIDTALLRQELRRWNWLKEFGLEPWSAPQSVTFEDPWEEGWSPKECDHRAAEEKQIDKVVASLDKRKRENIRAALNGVAN